MRRGLLVSSSLLFLIAACSSSSSSSPVTGGTGSDAGTAADAAVTDDSGSPADSGAPVDKSATCASSFGQAIGSVGFARFDGTVVAVVPPNDQACAEPNSTHLVVQIMASGAVYRMVIDVDDNVAKGTIHTSTIQHALVGDPWSDGWHTLNLDYVSDLAQSSSSFASSTTDDAVKATTDALELGAKVSIYATAQGEADSAHLVHRNKTNQDGAIVIDPDGASPTWLLYAFSNQSF